MLISTAELRRHLDDPDWLVFDCRHDLFKAGQGLRLYREGHIRGAFFAPVDEALSGVKTGRNGRHPLPRPEDFAEFLANRGATAARQLVAYDDAGGQYASRFWWLARWIGLTRVAVLDGGYPKWIAEDGPVSADIPSPRAGGEIEARPDWTRVATAEEVGKRIAAKSGLVIDARAPERFRGDTEPIDPVAGHIPTAKNRPMKLNLNGDLTLKSPTELRREFEMLLGERKPADVMHQCGSGITACVNLLAMEHAGLAGSRLYAGSWSEWVADPSRPVARGE